MRRICAGRTVLIIAHRLSAVRDADRIIVMERGQIAEHGRHDELLRNPEGIYSHLYNLQRVGQRRAARPSPEVNTAEDPAAVNFTSAPGVAGEIA